NRLPTRTGEQARHAEGQCPYTIRLLPSRPAHGTGENGPCSLRGHYTVQGNVITASAMGYTAAMHKGTASFFASARLDIDGAPGEPHSLTLDEPGYWPSDEYVPVGSASWQLPEVRHGQSVTLVISGGYVFSAAAGRAAPMPATTERDFPLALN